MIRALLPLVLAAATLACRSTSVRFYDSPEEATQAILAAAEAGDTAEANRVFDSFARSSIQRDRVYATLYDAAQARYENGRAGDAALVLAFVTDRYPGAVAAKEALVYALFLERAERGAADGELTAAIDAAVADVRAASPTPAVWVDLAATQAALDAGDRARAEDAFASFLGAWDGSPAELMTYVEDLDRRLQSTR